jgi:hypothetical protein
MVVIAIEYPVLFFKQKATGLAPSSWGELTRRQFIAISRTVNGAEPDFRFLSQLTGISKRLMKKLSPYEMYQLSEAIDFIGQAGNSHAAFIIKRIPGTDFVSPKPKLGGMTFGQFIFTESHYNDWQVTKAEDDLNNFIASLFLPQGEKFNSETIAGNALKIKLIDLEIRQAIAFNYGLILVWLQKCYPLIFQDNVVETRHALSLPNEQTKQSQWLKIFESLVGEDLINRDRYAELSVHAVLRYLTNKYKENARQ